MVKLWWMQSTPLLPSLPGPLWPEVVAPDRVLSIDQIELKCVLTLNLVVWNRNVLTFKLPTHAKRIVRNRTVYMYENWFGIK